MGKEKNKNSEVTWSHGMDGKWRICKSFMRSKWTENYNP